MGITDVILPSFECSTLLPIKDNFNLKTRMGNVKRIVPNRKLLSILQERHTRSLFDPSHAITIAKRPPATLVRRLPGGVVATTFPRSWILSRKRSAVCASQRLRWTARNIPPRQEKEPVMYHKPS